MNKARQYRLRGRPRHEDTVPFRKSVLELAEAGESPYQIAKKLGRSYSAVIYHLRTAAGEAVLTTRQPDPKPDRDIPGCEAWLIVRGAKCLNSNRCYRADFGLCPTAYVPPPVPIDTEVRENGRSVLVTTRR